MEACRNGRRRIVLPALGGHVHRAGLAPLGLCWQRPGTVELAQQLAIALNRAGLWHTRSEHTAQRWIQQHPACPLFLVEQQDRLWLSPAAQAFLGRGECLSHPLGVKNLLDASGKIYPQGWDRGQHDRINPLLTVRYGLAPALQ